MDSASAEELVEFFAQELTPPAVSTVQHRQHQVHAIARVNLVAQAIGEHLCLSRLFPLLNEALSDSRSDPGLFLALSKALLSDDENCITLAYPWATLDFAWSHLAANEDLPVREMGLEILHKILVKVDLRSEKGRGFFDKHVRESVVGDLSKTPYLRTIAGIHYCAVVGNLLRTEDLERLCRHPVASVRVAVAQALPSFQEVSARDIGEALLADKSDEVILAALENIPVLGTVLESKLASPELLKSQCTALLHHDAYGVRIEALKALSSLALDAELGSDTMKLFASLVIDCAESDEEVVVRMEALKWLTFGPRLLPCIEDPQRVIEVIKGLDKAAGNDANARQILAKALLTLFLTYPKIVTLNDIETRLKDSENDGQVHLMLVSALLELDFLKQSPFRVELVKRLYLALRAGEIAENAFNATCWRSVSLAMDHVPATAALLGEQIWREECRGSDFIERSLSHSARSVGSAAADAVGELFSLWKGTDWLFKELLPAVGRVLLVQHDPTSQHALLALSEKVIGRAVLLEDDKEASAALRVCEDVAIKSLKSRAPAVRARGGHVAYELVRVMPDPSLLLAHVKRQLEHEHDAAVRKELERVLKACERRNSTPDVESQ